MVRFGRGSSISRTTDRTEFESRTEEIFLSTNVSRPALGPTNLHLNGYQIFFHAVKRPERDAGQSPLSSAEVEGYTLRLAFLCASITFAKQFYLNFKEWWDSK